MPVRFPLAAGEVGAVRQVVDQLADHEAVVELKMTLIAEVTDSAGGRRPGRCIRVADWTRLSGSDWTEKIIDGGVTLAAMNPEDRQDLWLGVPRSSSCRPCC